MIFASPKWAASVALSATLVACSSETSPRSRDPGTGTSRDAGTDTRPVGYKPDFTSIRCEPTLASLQNDVFAKACAFDSCHGNNPAWGLWLLSPKLSSELVGTQSATCKGWTRVVPGSPEQSFLWQKLSQTKPPCGERMPLWLGPLPDSVLACVNGWILSLAADGGNDASSADAAKGDAALDVVHD